MRRYCPRGEDMLTVVTGSPSILTAASAGRDHPPLRPPPEVSSLPSQRPDRRQHARLPWSAIIPPCDGRLGSRSTAAAIRFVTCGDSLGGRSCGLCDWAGGVLCRKAGYEAADHVECGCRVVGLNVVFCAG